MGLRLGSRISLLIVVSAVLCPLALLIGTTIFYWRLRRLDEALRATASKLESLQAEANAVQSKAHQLPEYPLTHELINAFAHPDNFRVYRSVADIPNPVRSAFAKAANEVDFIMADPNGRWEATDVIRAPELPRRRLASVAAFHISENHAEPIWHAYVPHEVADPIALTKALPDKRYREAPFF